MRAAIRGIAGLAITVLGVQTMPALAFAARENAAVSTFSTPAYTGDFPDPAVLAAGGLYWAYSTGSAGRNLQVIASSDLHSWSAPADPLPVLPRWASPGNTWAPSVLPVGGQYVMYYAVRDTALGMQCISVATSSTPGGPFQDTSSGPLICQTANGGSIDPNPYLDPSTGRPYLLWKSEDNAQGRPSHIWGQQLSSTGLTFAPGTSPSLLLTESAAWQSPVVEGPTVVRYGSTYYLFYGANDWSSANSGIGYATSNSLLGSYTNRSRSAPWLATTGGARGPQGPSIFRDASGNTRMAFAAWYGAVGYPNGGMRALWIGTLAFGWSGPALS